MTSRVVTFFHNIKLTGSVIYSKKEERGKVNGFINFANYIVMASGSLLGGYLYEHVAPQAPFMLAIATVLPSALLTLIFVKEPEKREE